MSFIKVHNDAPKLYLMALNEHLLRIEKRNTVQGDKTKSAYTSIFIINDHIVELPNNLGSHKLQELGDSASAFIHNNIGFHAIKLNPMSVERGNIIITLSDYIVSKDNAEAKFSYAGGREYTFFYNRTNQQYRILKTKAISF